MLTFKAKKPNRKPYPKELKTYGDHLRKKRLDLDLSQPQVAKILKVVTDSITQWELNSTKPSIKQIPKIISFLGYSPKVELNKIKQYRIERGITQKEMARILNIVPSTLAGIEKSMFIKNKRIMLRIEKIIKNSF